VGRLDRRCVPHRARTILYKWCIKASGLLLSARALTLAFFRREMAELSAASYDPNMVRQAAAATPPPAAAGARQPATPLSFTNLLSNFTDPGARKPWGVGIHASKGGLDTNAWTTAPPQHLGLRGNSAGGVGSIQALPGTYHRPSPSCAIHQMPRRGGGSGDSGVLIHPTLASSALAVLHGQPVRLAASVLGIITLVLLLAAATPFAPAMREGPILRERILAHSGVGSGGRDGRGRAYTTGREGRWGWGGRGGGDDPEMGYVAGVQDSRTEAAVFRSEAAAAMDRMDEGGESVSSALDPRP
jgi:hypothetical protein